MAGLTGSIPDSMTHKKIQVVCQRRLVSGGAESLHNLVLQLRGIGLRANLVYFPEVGVDEAQTSYYFADYGLLPTALDDSRETIVIFPETLCMEALKLKHAQAAIWWLSVDNFLRIKYGNLWDKWRYFKSVMRGERPFGGVKALRRLRHFSKCRYDEIFLAKHGIHFERITGPISYRYIEASKCLDVWLRQKKDWILYSPETPKSILTLVRIELPKVALVEMKGYSSDEMISLYRQAKVFMDFGNHPGQERMPREAAVMGCFVITGMKGAAANDEDLPLAPKYKLNVRSFMFTSTLTDLVNEAIKQHESMWLDQRYFRRYVAEQFDNQRKQLIAILRGD